MGINPDSGTYFYAEGETGGPIFDVLNRAASAEHDARLTDREALGQLEDWVGEFTELTPAAAVPLNSTYFNAGPLDNIGTSADPKPPLTYKRIGQRVIVGGSANTGVVPGNWTVLGTLPVGFRPATPTPFFYMFGYFSDVHIGVVKTNGQLLLGQAPPSSGTDVTLMNAEFSTV